MPNVSLFYNLTSPVPETINLCSAADDVASKIV